MPSMSKFMRTTHLGNWREAPHNRWAFHHVHELIPTAKIRNDPRNVSNLNVKHTDFADWKFNADGNSMTLNEVLVKSWTDGFLVLHEGSVVFEWLAPHYDGIEPHILFSVSKSITGGLTGILVDNGQLNLDETISAYVPGMTGSGFEDCTVRNVLDMQAGVDFEEDYTGTSEQFNRYRAATGWDPLLPGHEVSDLRTFLAGIKHGSAPHGKNFLYLSPNTDILGLVLEAVSATTLSQLFSQYIWRPLGAESAAYITVDRCGAPRAAGGMCACLRDLARLGQMMFEKGHLNGKQIIPFGWVEDTMTRGDREAWQQGGFSQLMPQGGYRNHWYQIGNPNGVICAIGIHGQWIYIDPATEVVIVKLSSQPDPIDQNTDYMLLKFYDAVSNAFK